jgi:hypothetical protein
MRKSVTLRAPVSSAVACGRIASLSGLPSRGRRRLALGRVQQHHRAGGRPRELLGHRAQRRAREAAPAVRGGDDHPHLVHPRELEQGMHHRALEQRHVHRAVGHRAHVGGGRLELVALLRARGLLHRGIHHGHGGERVHGRERDQLVHPNQLDVGAQRPGHRDAQRNGRLGEPRTIKGNEDGGHGALQWGVYCTVGPGAGGGNWPTPDRVTGGP